MLIATAAATALIRITAPSYGYEPISDVSVIQLLAASVRYLSNNRPEDLIYAPSPITPTWLVTTQHRIRNSIVSNDRVTLNDGRWLSQDIADAASAFFKKTADVLPGEPFIYSSQIGDLVAEFKAKHGTLTSIVSSSFILLFAVIDGVPLERRVFEDGDIRGEVQRLTGLLRTGQHGAVDTIK